MESITNPDEKFKLVAFYKELDEWIATFGAEATLMSIDDGVMAVLRYRVSGVPHIAILTQHDYGDTPTEIQFFSLEGQHKIDSLKAALTQSYV